MNKETADQVLRDAVVRVVTSVLDLPEPAVREWAMNIDPAEVVAFDGESATVLLAAVPLLMLDMALARARRDHGLSYEQSEAERLAIVPELRAAWPRMFAGGEVEYPKWIVEVDGQDVPLDDVIGLSCDAVERWWAARR